MKTRPAVLFWTTLFLVSMVSLPVATAGAPTAGDFCQTPGCCDCQPFDPGGGDFEMYCGWPDNNSWGAEYCEIISISNHAICRVSGWECYYTEVH